MVGEGAGLKWKAKKIKNTSDLLRGWSRNRRKLQELQREVKALWRVGTQNHELPRSGLWNLWWIRVLSQGMRECCLCCCCKDDIKSTNSEDVEASYVVSRGISEIYYPNPSESVSGGGAFEPGKTANEIETPDADAAVLITPVTVAMPTPSDGSSK